jgi:carboxypeptidase family protein
MTLNVFGCDEFAVWSVAVHDTIVVPTGKVEPDVGAQLTVGALSTRSVADAVNVAIALLAVDVVSTIEMSAGTVRAHETAEEPTTHAGLAADYCRRCRRLLSARFVGLMAVREGSGTKKSGRADQGWVYKGPDPKRPKWKSRIQRRRDLSVPMYAVYHSTFDLGPSLPVNGGTMNWRSAVAMCITLLVAASAHAQFDSAQISGVVRDATGAILPGVDVVLLNAGTSNERRTVTNEAGLYTFPSVPVGEYRITATLSGFKPITKAMRGSTSGSMFLSTSARSPRASRSRRRRRSSIRR